MKVEITSGVYADGKPYAVGDTPDLSDRDAKLLIGMGKAVKFSGTTKPATKKRAEVNRAKPVGITKAGD